MFNHCLRIFLFVGLFALAGCDKVGGDSQTKAAKDVTAALQDVSDAVGGVTDKASAEAAVPKMHAAANRIKAVAERMKKRPAASKEENDAIQKQVKPQMDQIKTQMQASLSRLQGKPDVMQVLQEPMMKVQFELMGVEFAAVRGPESTVHRPPPSAGPPMGGGAAGNQAAIEQSIAQARQQAEQRKQAFLSKYTPQQIVTVEIINLPKGVRTGRLLSHLNQLAGVKESNSTGATGQKRVMLAPVDDVQALADKIDFGKVTSVESNARVIHVEADEAKVSSY